MKKLPKPPNKFTLDTVFQYYKGIFKSDYFNLHTISPISKNTKVSKAAGLDNLSGRFLKDGAKVSAIPITEVCNLAKLKPIYKKDFLTDASYYKPISLLPLISKVIEKVITIKLTPLSTLEIYYKCINLAFAKIIPLTSVSHL